MSMDRYTLFCTESQTKKAIELGAPIQYASIMDIRLSRFVNTDKECYALPTAEQMIYWLEDQELIESIEISKQMVTWTGYIWLSMDRIKLQSFNSRKEATLAAIDAALEYLKKNK